MKNIHDWDFHWFTDWEKALEAHDLFWDQSILNKESARHVFFSPPLVKAWVVSYRAFSHIEPRFLLAKKTDGEVVFYPLVMTQKDWKNSGLRILHSVGLSEYDYHEPLASSQKIEWDEFWKAFITEVMGKWGKSIDRISIHGLSKKHASPFSSEDSVEVAPYIDLSEFTDKEAYLASLKSSLRGDVRRQIRRLSEEGEVKLKVYSSTEVTQAKASLNCLLEEHCQRWPNSFKAPRFHQSLLERGLTTGVVHFSELCVGDKVISWHLGFCDGGQFYWYMPTYLPAYHNLSPGKIHMFFCIDEAIKGGLDVFDMLKGDEGYKSKWANGSNDLYNVEFDGERKGVSLRLLLNEKVKPWVNRVMSR